MKRRAMDPSCLVMRGLFPMPFLVPLLIFTFLFLYLSLATLTSPGEASEGEASEDDEAAITLPDDESGHPDAPQERWIFSSLLKTKEGRSFYSTASFQLRRSGFLAGNGYSITTTDHEREKFYHEHGEVKESRVRTSEAPDRLSLDWDGNLLEKLEESPPEYRLKLTLSRQAIDLRWVARKPALLNGRKGIIAFGEGNSAHYYSLSKCEVKGRITVDGKEWEVSGEGWIDHQWGAWKGTKRGYQGKDTFRIQLDDGTDVHILSFREVAGSKEDLLYIHVIGPDGSTRLYERGSLRATDRWKSPSRVVYPSGWEIELPGEKLDLKLTPHIQDGELILKYLLLLKFYVWEGSCRVSGRLAGKEVQGRAFVELTGYE
jgi:predicted secreted hydrolase